jgi:hypothetical protein
MFYEPVASDTWTGRQTKVDAPHDDEGTRETEYRDIDLCRFLREIGKTRPPLSPQSIVYEYRELYVRVNERMMAWAAGRLIDLIGRHTGGVAISVTLASTTRARCEFFEARVVTHESDLSVSSNPEHHESTMQGTQSGYSCGIPDLEAIEKIVSFHGGQITFGFTGARGLTATLDLPIDLARLQA